MHTIGLRGNYCRIRRMVAADGLTVLMDIIATHPKNADIIRQALHLIDAAAMLPENLDKL